MVAIDHKLSPGVTVICWYLLGFLLATEVLLADEIVERPAPITTNKDMDIAVLASRFACIAFILTFLR